MNIIVSVIHCCITNNPKVIIPHDPLGQEFVRTQLGGSLFMTVLLVVVIHLADSAGGSAGMDSPKGFTHVCPVSQSFSSSLLLSM